MPTSIDGAIPPRRLVNRSEQKEAAHLSALGAGTTRRIDLMSSWWQFFSGGKFLLSDELVRVNRIVSARNVGSTKLQGSADGLTH